MVGSRNYVPKCGDVVWIPMNPQASHEQAGHRPAVVLSPQTYNSEAGLAIPCPITNQIKGYPFEVLFPEGLLIEGAILSDQVKSLDWHSRNVEFICTLSDETISEILQKLSALLSQ